ncbi:hypothetical protein V6615_14370 [Oscillospiraceae bacterium PP1C4]
MTTELIIEILKVVGYALLGGLILYFKTKESLREKVAGIITEAEEAYKDTTNTGGIKFEYAVDKLYSLIPSALKVFVTREMTEKIVQSTFDNLEAYAKTQLDKLVEKVTK